MLIWVLVQSLQAENVKCSAFAAHLWHRLCFISSENLWQLESLSSLVAESRVIFTPMKEEKKIDHGWVTLYIQTILIQFKTAVQNTVLHIYPKDHIFYTLYIFLQYDTVYGLEEILFSDWNKKKTKQKQICPLKLFRRTQI